MSETKHVDFRLPEHVAKKLTAAEEANEAAKHFSNISIEYDPLSPENLPDRVNYTLNHAPCQGHPDLPDWLLYQQLKARRATGGVDGDIPPKIVKQCLPELIKPMGILLRKSFEQKFVIGN